MKALCWALIVVGRALEWARLHWNSLWIDDWSPFLRWTMRRDPKHSKLIFYTRFGYLATDWLTSWMYSASKSLTVTANRGLPPLRSGQGFLIRLYEKPFMASR